MANYEFTVISNDFKVKNPKEVCGVFEGLGYEYSTYTNDSVALASYETCWDTDHVVLMDKKDKRVLNTVLSCDIDFFDLQEWLEDTLLDDEYTCDDIEQVSISDYIQYQLLDDSYCAIKEVGNEKLRYNIGVADVITKRGNKFFNLDSLVEKYIKELDL